MGNLRHEALDLQEFYLLEDTWFFFFFLFISESIFSSLCSYFLTEAYFTFETIEKHS